MIAVINNKENLNAIKKLKRHHTVSHENKITINLTEQKTKD